MAFSAPSGPHQPKSPPTAIVPRVLSAMGSMTVPTTVWRFHRLAIHPSAKSVAPA
ncbi:MAG: hypothetical protein Q9179_004928 [Wetmoreana sp. 5 TL-2023]